MNKVSIVIPTFNHWDLTHQLLLDIYRYNRDVDEILLIDDASTEDISGGLAWWKDMLPQLKAYRLKENHKFLKACNKGVPKATGDIIMLISNDVRMQDNIVKLVKNIFRDDSKLIVGATLYSGSTGWNEFKKGKRHKIFPYLDGSVLIFTKKAWEELDGFDERYAPFDFEDVDFSTKAIDKGYALVPLSSTKVRHIGSQTNGYSPERWAITSTNRKKFAEKWKVTYYDI